MRPFIQSCLLFLLLSPNLSFGQGCSDAGFCTMGAMKPNQHFTNKINFKLKSVEFGQYAGLTKFGDIILTYLVDANFALNRKTSVQVKLPYTLVSGFLAKNSGTGDISLSASRNLLYTENYQINFTIGGKIPTSDGNQKNSEGRPLPMYYQTSLGTYDGVIGFSMITKKWLFATGYQQAFNTNNSTFVWGAWAGTPFQERVKEYPTSKYLKRGNDIMFRIERNFRSSRFNTYVGLLPIYRISMDERINPQTKKVEKVKGSTGLAITALYGFGFKFSVKSSVKFLFGVSLHSRPTNPDGLSRKVVNMISYEYRF